MSFEADLRDLLRQVDDEPTPDLLPAIAPRLVRTSRRPALALVASVLVAVAATSFLLGVGWSRFQAAGGVMPGSVESGLVPTPTTTAPSSLGPSPSPTPVAAVVTCVPEVGPLPSAMAGDPCPEVIAAVRALVEPLGTPVSIYVEAGAVRCLDPWDLPGDDICLGPIVLPGTQMHGWVTFAETDKVAAVSTYRVYRADGVALPSAWSATLTAFEVPSAGFELPVSPTPSPAEALVTCVPEIRPLPSGLGGDPCLDVIAAVRSAVGPLGTPTAIYVEAGSFYCGDLWPGAGPDIICRPAFATRGTWMHGWVTFAGTDRVAAVSISRDPHLQDGVATPSPWTAKVLAFEAPPAGFTMPPAQPGPTPSPSADCRLDSQCDLVLAAARDVASLDDAHVVVLGGRGLAFHAEVHVCYADGRYILIDVGGDPLAAGIRETPWDVPPCR